MTDELVNASIEVILKNCYGIGSLRETFDFAEPADAHVIYAPNGAMKTSFTNAFEDAAMDRDTADPLFPDRQAERKILGRDGLQLSPEQILTIPSFRPQYELTSATARLLSNPDLQARYQKLHEQVASETESFLALLASQSGVKKGVAREISSAFETQEPVPAWLDNEVLSQIDDADPSLADIPYTTVVDSKVQDALSDPALRAGLEQYVTRHREVLESSSYFSHSTFTLARAGTLSKELVKNAFFEAGHSVVLNDKAKHGATESFQSASDIDKLIKAERERIATDATLKGVFTKLDAALERNVQVKAFHELIKARPDLIPHLQNLPTLYRNLWIGYVAEHREEAAKLAALYRSVKVKLAEIAEEARAHTSAWEHAAEEFNERFDVPFRLIVANRTDVVLGVATLPAAEFEFIDIKDGEPATPDRLTLEKTLSQGERRALYLLHVIFDIEARRRAGGEPTLVIVDDIADSFDYRNKYAIIQYLHEIAHDPQFQLIALTHNFDFFRTVIRRGVATRGHIATRNSKRQITLRKPGALDNPFLERLRPHFFTHPAKRAATIPFLRNLLEYTKGPTHEHYSTLTSLLHWKAETPTITNATLAQIYEYVTDGVDSHGALDSTALVYCDIFAAADTCSESSTGNHFNLEDKIVLSIASRLHAERYMIERIDDADWVGTITRNQTSQLLTRYKKDFKNEREQAKALDAVNLLTPEHIHLNSFMYEPLLDMSDVHLRKAYADVRNLFQSITTSRP
ncbi:MAG: phage infection protein [Thermoleophilia bacterium]|nr:phage infection protein [Thermoleophilia bacterium]